MISTAIGDHFPRVRPIVNDYALGFPRVFFFFLRSELKNARGNDYYLHDGQ